VSKPLNIVDNIFLFYILSAKGGIAMNEKVIELLISMNEKLDLIVNSLNEIESDSEMTRIIVGNSVETLEAIQENVVTIKHSTSD